MTKIQDQTELVVGKKYRNKHNVDRTDPVATILFVGEFPVFYRLEYQYVILMAY